MTTYFVTYWLDDRLTLMQRGGFFQLIDNPTKHEKKLDIPETQITLMPTGSGLSQAVFNESIANQWVNHAASVMYQNQLQAERFAIQTADELPIDESST